MKNSIEIKESSGEKKFKPFDSWDSSAIDENCPVFVHAITGNAGLGDQLEHYIYSLHLAKIFHATMIVEGFHEGGGQSMKYIKGKQARHSGASEYSWIASTLFGIKMVYNLSYITSKYNLKILDIKYDKAVELHKNFASTNRSLLCNTMIKSDIYSCDKEWCHLVRHFQGLESNLWTLRNNNAKSKCLKIQERNVKENLKNYDNLIKLNTSMLQVVWHVRQGDICLHCNDEAYYDRIFKMLNESLVGLPYRLAFESQEEILFLKNKFPKSIFIYNATLKETVCNFITCDILITSGSSLAPLVAAFGGKPWHPLVFEEKIRDVALRQQRKTDHYFSRNEAVLMDDGFSQLSQFEIRTIMKNLFS